MNEPLRDGVSRSGEGDRLPPAGSILATDLLPLRGHAEHRPPRALSFFRRRSGACLLVLTALTWIAPNPQAKPASRAKPDPDATTLSPWLVLGPASDPLPVFHDEIPGKFGLADRLAAAQFPWDLLDPPRAGGTVDWFGARLTWSPRAAPTVELKPPADRDRPAVAWLAAHVSVDRWSTFELEVAGRHPRRAWLDGKPIAMGGTDAKDASDVHGAVETTTGTHLLVIETLYDPARGAPWTAGARLRLEPGGKDTPKPTSKSEGKTAKPSTSPGRARSLLDTGLTVSLEPARTLDILDVLDAPRVASIAIDPSGTLVAASYERILPQGAEKETWIEFRSAADARLRNVWRGGRGMEQADFSPDGRWISYVTRDAAPADAAADATPTATLWLSARDTGEVRPLVERFEGLDGYLWSPDGSAMVVWSSKKPEADERGVKRLEGLRDRQAGHRTLTRLTRVAVPSGATRRLTAGAVSVAASGFSPDGRRLLFTRDVEDLGERPFSRTELWEIDLATFEAKRLRDSRWLSGAQYAPDGRRLLLLAGPSEFGALGVNVPPGMVPNEHDQQLFVWDPATDQADPITRDFGPAVKKVVWSRNDGRIYLQAEQADFVRLFRWDPQDRRFTPIPSGVDVVGDLDLAEAAPRAVLTGTSPWTPQQVQVVSLDGAPPVLLDRPGERWFRHVRAGGLESWEFTTSRGKTIPGRVYLPPGFDPARRYPCIVFFYGGTSPTSREWGGRYPKEWWASNGYVVYTLQPSGATGYGQAHSALHVNDWGEIVGEEILEGTRAFLAAHPYVDPARVGCIGASFGGFLTELLVTKTDLYAAAVAHAGISSIASYWGEGYWGYSYSASASAFSFPWNRKDIFVDRSPLFHADKVKTPILLTHGTADKNVPVGESDTFYTALKLVGAPVEYVQVEGEDHWILTHDKRALWSRTIVAWFDRWLKRQPDWWEHLYPVAGAARGPADEAQ